MLAATLPAKKTRRPSAPRETRFAYAPSEERFDRITRTARRLLHVPIALISIVEQDEQWFRSVQGLQAEHAPRDLAFCGHAVALNQPVCIHDTWADRDFHDNPLVTGEPGIRSYLGWPLQIAPDVAVGSLCVIDTMPRIFSQDERDALQDLARMAETELKIRAMSSLQNKLVMRLSTLQRRGALDPLTGCWNIRGFRELLALGVEEARDEGGDLAVCTMQVLQLDDLAAAANFTNRDALTQMLAQVLRQRLPETGALARLGPATFCALVPAASALALEEELARLTYPKATVNLPDDKLGLDIPLDVNVSWLADLGARATADQMWAHALKAYPQH